MARYIGIDIGSTHVRAVALASSFKRVRVEAMNELTIGEAGLEAAVAAAVQPLLAHAEGLSVAIDGDRSFVHQLSLPATAAKQIAEVLPFELEALVPVDMSELVYGHRVLSQAAGESIEVIAALAPKSLVRERIELVSRAAGREPERVGAGPLVLANLARLSAALRGSGARALVDLGNQRSDVAVLLNGEVMFARTLSQGVAGLPASAGPLASALKQTFLSFVSQHGGPIESLVLLGGGASAEGAGAYLSDKLGVPVTPLPALDVEFERPELALSLARFAKALALAAGLFGRPLDVNVRSGELAYERGFGFLKEKMPVLAGLALATAVSFLFATWAELRALDREQASLAQALALETQRSLGEETDDPERANELLDKVKSRDEVDPMPQMDAFDVIVELSKVVPESITHDVDEFEMQRNHVKLSGVVGTTADAQLISSKFAENACVSDPKIAKVTQVVNGERQKYVLEFDVKCSAESGTKKRSTAPEAGEAQP